MKGLMFGLKKWSTYSVYLRLKLAKERGLDQIKIIEMLRSCGAHECNIKGALDIMKIEEKETRR